MERMETVEAADRDNVLARVLAQAGGSGRASRAQVRSFVDYMSISALEWTAWRLRRGRRETALAFVLFIPGKTAIAMFPGPEATGIEPDDQRHLLSAALGRLADRALYYVQVLVEPQAVGKRNFLEASGFRHLTQLIYLQRGTASSPADAPGTSEASWIPYDRSRHDQFARMLLATYEDSRDCPELTGVRSIDAVIASHKAAGEFNPALWEIACLSGEHAGCILLSPLAHGPMLEVVYMGVAPGWRRRGVGQFLLSRALVHCAALGAARLTAVVDRRNTPARQLYARFGFKPMARREAYIYFW
jgi:ribosomal protein S18 acetylase RimI-like enzyme